jgi:hypothetical protein
MDTTHSRSPLLYISAALWAVTYIVALFILRRMEVARPWGVVIAIAPVLPFAFFLWRWIAYVQSCDELERRVQLEALAIAFPLTLLGLMGLGLLELALPLSKDDWSYRHIWSFLPLLYFIGLAVAWRRYR